MKNVDFYKILGELYALRDKTDDAIELLDRQEFNSALRENFQALRTEMEDFDSLLTEQIIGLLKLMLEDEQ